MKQIFKKIIIFILTLEARIVLKKYNPRIVAITGNIGKTISKDAVYTVLSSAFFVRKSQMSFNSEIGIPLTILGLPNAWSDFFLWMQNIIDALKLIVLKNHYPKWLVLEVGADRPGDIKSISRWLKPDVVVMTHLPDVPVHIEFFDSAQDVIEEKSHLVKALKDDGAFIVNADEKKTLALKSLVGERKVYAYGNSPGSSIIGSNYNILYKERFPSGISFRVDYNSVSVPVEIEGVLGKQHIYPILSALAAGVSQGLNIASMGQALEKHETPAGRMKLIEGINDSLIIDDSYNSSPVALKEALNTFKSINSSGKKIAVLGDMMELGSHSVESHINAGKLAAEAADILITVGIRAKYIAQGAMENKMKKKEIFQFNDSKSAGEKLAAILNDGDITLIKGSQSVRMERIVEKVMAYPEKKYRLLVRQGEEWQIR
ncbi:MAG: Mur ligase family protein [Candidatus Pacebacteria bacterium]|jgi:UDP-N-acetylmuramoyl-tripeptide--D-alanyl-D-alanine ligase|nr:Mur ligase family protein [Candidatus Paceibacterota bacterium]|tara:strand:+ start:62382 stop:63674 length:1293 start_codon:yes stop_codon:yes gene_type:complete